jgi:hypothetical protein
MGARLVLGILGRDLRGASQAATTLAAAVGGIRGRSAAHCGAFEMGVNPLPAERLDGPWAVRERLYRRLRARVERRQDRQGRIMSLVA